MRRNNLEAARQSAIKQKFITSIFLNKFPFAICYQEVPSFSSLLNQPFCVICKQTGFISTSIVETELSLLNYNKNGFLEEWILKVN